MRFFQILYRTFCRQELDAGELRDVEEPVGGACIENNACTLSARLLQVVLPKRQFHLDSLQNHPTECVFRLAQVGGEQINNLVRF